MRYNKFKDCYTKENLEMAVKNSVSFNDTLRHLGIPVRGCNADTLKRYIKKFKIDTSYFTGKRVIEKIYIPAAEYFKNIQPIKSRRLLYKLYREGYKEHKCEICGIETWQERPIVFQLHHIDGNPDNNRLDNLQVLCPNCHSQTDNYCGGANKKKHYYCIECGREISHNSASGKCLYCVSKSRRKTVRPPVEVLQQDVNTLGFCGAGRKYGVTDNTIRKWLGTKK